MVKSCYNIYDGPPEVDLIASAIRKSPFTPGSGLFLWISKSKLASLFPNVEKFLEVYDPALHV